MWTPHTKQEFREMQIKMTLEVIRKHMATNVGDNVEEVFYTVPMRA